MPAMGMFRMGRAIAIAGGERSLALNPRASFFVKIYFNKIYNVAIIQAMFDEKNK